MSTPQSNLQLSIIVPAYNEEARLGRMLDAYLPYFDQNYGDEFELVVVVNGSRDATEDVAASFLARYPQLQVIVETRAIGKGGAITRYATRTWRLDRVCGCRWRDPPEPLMIWCNG